MMFHVRFTLFVGTETGGQWAGKKHFEMEVYSSVDPYGSMSRARLMKENEKGRFGARIYGEKMARAIADKLAKYPKFCTNIEVVPA
jgi:hypothetical protein